MKCDRCNSAAQFSVPVQNDVLNFCKECHEQLQIRTSFENMIAEVLAIIEREDSAKVFEMLEQFWRDNCSRETEGWLGYSMMSFKSDFYGRFGQLNQALSILKRLDAQCWPRLEAHVTNKLAAAALMSDAGETKEAVRELESAIERLNSYFVVCLVSLLKRYAMLAKEQNVEIRKEFVPLIKYLATQNNQNEAEVEESTRDPAEVIDSLVAPLPIASIF